MIYQIGLENAVYQWHPFMLRAIVATSLSLAAALPAVETFDHAAAIQSMDDEDARAGGKLYTLHCAACHGEDGNLALNPLARRFAKDELKYGTDPYALWKTISYGNGLMFRWDAVLTAEQRYQIVQHLREDIIKPKNPDQYFEPDEAYYQTLNQRAAADAKAQAQSEQKVAPAPGMIDGSGGTRMIYGPFMQHAVVYGPIKDKNAAHIENATEKAIIIDLPGHHVICYDAARLSVSGIWTGDELADTRDTHHTSYKGSRPLMPSGELHFHQVDTPGWIGGAVVYRGLYLRANRVVLRYQVGHRTILETPDATPNEPTFGRHLRVAPGDVPLRCLIAQPSPNAPGIETLIQSGDSRAKLVVDDQGALWLAIPPSKDPLTLSIWFSPGREIRLPDDLAPPDFDDLTKDGPRRWPQTVQTAVALGENLEGYAADELTVPLANPYGCWMRLTALGFFSDGRLAVATLSGDVWIVTWTPDNPNALTWSRFAAGLYEPMGLEIVDDLLYVRGRDRITRLHDRNRDGEADYYESFYEDPGEIGAGYHAFSYDLVTDQAGCFYFAQGAWKSPLPGAVVRVSRDGNQAEIIASDLRNPNGLGAGGPNNWLTVADNPSGKALYNGFALLKEGASYGFQHPRTTPMLVVLPARVDSSSAGQCWSDPHRWGPLSGSIIHNSYSRSAIFYCFIQDLLPYPNGFAIKFPFHLRAGAMRARVNPTDGQVYIACKKGWDSIARYDGALYRIRHTGQPSHFITQAAATRNGIRLTFACDLLPASIARENFTIIREPDKPAKDLTLQPKPVAAVRLIDARTLELTLAGIGEETLEHRTGEDGTVRIRPAISLTAKLRAADGTALEQTVHATINALPK